MSLAHDAIQGILLAPITKNAGKPMGCAIRSSRFSQQCNSMGVPANALLAYPDYRFPYPHLMANSFLPRGL